PQDIAVRDKTTSQTLDWMPEILEIIEVYDEDADEEEEEEDEDDTEGSFSLRAKIVNAEQTELPPGKENIVIEVVKFRQSNVIDVCFLQQKKKYYRRDGHKRFCLVEHKDPERCYFFFNDQCNGQVRINDTRNIALSRLTVPENIYRKRRRIYRYPLPKNGSVFLSDGYDEYLLRMVAQGKSPQVPEPVKPENSFYKNLIKSSVFHILLIILGGLFISLRAPILSPTSPDRPRFVQIGTSQIADNLEKIRKSSIKEPEVNRAMKKQSKKHSRTTPVKKRASSQKNAKGERMISRSPNAGGGSGKAGGNVLNRNIKQAGILGALGMKEGVGIGVQEAIASVTNLDAVPSSHKGGGGFKVAGIVGKVEGSKIEVPSVGLVNTKGSGQVFRSAGVEGQGDVAALEVGETGRNQVMAMVTADLSRKVHIQGGGMSREAVKRVIDQHLDEITYCYEAALISDPSIMGKIVFEWKILLEGTVGEVRINFSSIQSTEIHSCIKEKIKSWQFPEPHGREVIVSYPFIFDIVGF
ncbi:MAG: AgmX/PglI C-terminal domain-containing protein, partial [bacterium]